MSRSERPDIDFKWSDAWLLQSVWYAGEGGAKPAALKDIIGMGDALNHAMFTNGELRNGFSKLVQAGYLSEEKGSFKPEGTALRFLAGLSRKGVGPVTLIDRAAEFLGVGPHEPGSVLPEDPVWPYPSLTDKVIARACRDYSRDFAKRHRELEEASRNPLSNAYLRKDIPKLKELVEGGTDVNLRDKDGRTVLMHAASKGNLEVVRYLVGKGAKLGLQDQQGDTALHCAAWKGSEEVARFLIERGAVVDARNRWGGTPLWTAVNYSRGGGETIRLLLEKGADADLKGARDKSPLELALERKDVDLLRFFKDP